MKDSQRQQLKKGKKISKSWMFRLFKSRAMRILAFPTRVGFLLSRATKAVEKHDSFRSFARGTLGHIGALFRLTGSFIKGEYKGIGKGKVALIVASILYFLSPLDIVPDAIPVLGFLDDIALFTWLTTTLGNELEEFEAWENMQLSSGGPIIDTDYEEVHENGIAANK